MLGVLEEVLEEVEKLGLKGNALQQLALVLPLSIGFSHEGLPAGQLSGLLGQGDRNRLSRGGGRRESGARVVVDIVDKVFAPLLVAISHHLLDALVGFRPVEDGEYDVDVCVSLEERLALLVSRPSVVGGQHELGVGADVSMVLVHGKSGTGCRS